MEHIKPQRASKTKKIPPPEQRGEIRAQLIKKLLMNEISLGQVLKYLRLNVLVMKQEQYAKFVNVSRKTLSDLENDKGNYSVEIINQVLRPFELQVGILPINRALLGRIFTQQPPTFTE